MGLMMMIPSQSKGMIIKAKCLGFLQHVCFLSDNGFFIEQKNGTRKC